MLRDRIIGCFFGIAIGDALGLPCESLSSDEIKNKFGYITTYKSPVNHKYYGDGFLPGTTSDDTQLTLAVAESIIESGLDMDSQAKWHIAAMKDKTKGWGASTKNSIRRLANNCHWNESGESGVGGKGSGNGVAMKISPISAYVACKVDRTNGKHLVQVMDFIKDFASMTHRSSVAVSSALCQASAVFYCLTTSNFDKNTFINLLNIAAIGGKTVFSETLTDDLSVRIRSLQSIASETSDKEIVDNYGGGSCYVYDSLPFTYAFLIRNPNTIESLYDVASAGGDTDSNASMLGGMLGALHGYSIFPENLVNELLEIDRVKDVANRFCDYLGVK